MLLSPRSKGQIRTELIPFERDLCIVKVLNTSYKIRNGLYPLKLLNYGCGTELRDQLHFFTT